MRTDNFKIRIMDKFLSDLNDNLGAKIERHVPAHVEFNLSSTLSSILLPVEMSILICDQIRENFNRSK